MQNHPLRLLFGKKQVVRIHFSLIICILFCLGGCVFPKAITTSTPVGTTPNDEFATMIGEAPQGTEKIFPITPYGGSATVIVGTGYTSGLSQECRAATILETHRQLAVAVCKGPEGWTSLPSIFEATSR